MIGTRILRITVIAMVITGLRSGAAQADTPDVFVFGGPSVTTSTSSSLAPAKEVELCRRCAGDPESAGSASARALVMLGIGIVGTEGRLRGGVELLSFVTASEPISGYSAVATYAGVDLGRAFLQSGLGIGRYWGPRAEDGDRIAGIAHVELGVRLLPGFSVLARGDLLLAREETSLVGTLGLQWVPRVFGRSL